MRMQVTKKMKMMKKMMKILMREKKKMCRKMKMMMMKRMNEVLNTRKKNVISQAPFALVIVNMCLCQSVSQLGPLGLS